MENTAKVRNRVESLDWLRGAMAVSVMLFHLGNWTDVSSPIGRLGIYAVAVFFVLSGLSMAIVYDAFIRDLRTSAAFFVRRLFRIWPLLWMCIALVCLAIASGWTTGSADPWKVFINVTTLFGFVDPTAYLNQGAWSIGNEMVYYALTPVLLVVYRKSRLAGRVVLMASFAVLVTFAFWVVRPTSIADQWSSYINPFNNLFFYVAGIALYYEFATRKVPQKVVLALALVSVALFCAIPAAGDRIEIVVGWSRLAFTALCVMLVLAFYKFQRYDRVPSAVASVLDKFGMATYGIYLLHPIVNLYVTTLFQNLHVANNPLRIAVAILLTVVLALLSYYGVERRLIRLGKTLTSSGMWVPRRP